MSLRVQRRQCATCIFRKDSTLDLKALLDAVRERVRGGFVFFRGHRICHHSRDAVCAGFWRKYRDRYQLGQLAQRLGFVEYVDDDTEHTMKRLDVIRFNEHMPTIFRGKLAKIVRVSRRTGGLTVELLEDVSEAYCKGREVAVAPYQVKPATVVRA